LLALGLLGSSAACAQAFGIHDPIPGLTNDAALGADDSVPVESGESIEASDETAGGESGDTGTDEGPAQLDASDESADGFAAADADTDTAAAPPQDGASEADALGDAIGRSDGPIEADVVTADAPSDAMGGPDPTLLGYWSFDEGTGATAADSSGHGNNGSLQGGATWGAGKVGSHCLALKAVGAFVDVPRPVVDTTKPYTVSAWANMTRFNGGSNSHYCIAGIDGNATSGFYFTFHGDGYAALTLFQTDVSSSAYAEALSSATAVAGTWYYLTGVFDGSSVKLYVDGALNNTTSVPPPWAALGHTAFGRSRWSSANTDYFVGSIDEVRMYSRALTTPEIQALYALH
jgi:hypothetical protein